MVSEVVIKNNILDKYIINYPYKLVFKNVSQKAILPTLNEIDNSYNIYSCEDVIIKSQTKIYIDTGLIIKNIPEHIYLKLNTYNYDLQVINNYMPLCVDENLIIYAKNISDKDIIINYHEPIANISLYPKIKIQNVIWEREEKNEK